MPAQQGNSGVPRPGEADAGFFGMTGMGSLNTKLDRVGIDDQDFSWLLNCFPVGNMTLRAMPSNGAQIFTHGGASIIYMFPFNMTATAGIVNNISGQFIAVFFSDGTALDINLATFAVRQITVTPNLFFDATTGIFNPAARPCCTQYGSNGIIIVSRVQSGNGYWAWDGNLYTPGSPSPSWLNGGTPTTMPTGVQGHYVDTFAGHVWVEGAGPNANNVAVSLAANGAQFGGPGTGQFGSQDSFLRSIYTGFKVANGFGYLFADSSINVISNVNVSGSPAVLTFNNQNIDPQVGTSWSSTIQVFGRAIIFANPVGVWKLEGGAADKISDPLDSIFATIDATPQTGIFPSATVHTIFDQRVYCLLIRALDKITNANRNFLCVWNGEKWFLASQDNALVYIATQEFFSVLQGWGTDGAQVFSLFNNFSPSLDKYIQTKLWSGQNWITYRKILREYLLVRNIGADPFNVDGTIDILTDTGQSTSISLSGFIGLINWVNNVGAVVQWQNALGQNVNWFGTAPLAVGSNSLGATGLCVGLTLHSTASNFTILAVGLLYQEVTPFGG